MNKLPIAAALYLVAAACAVAVEPSCARKFNAWTGKRGEPTNFDPKLLAVASAFAQPGDHRHPNPAAANPVMPQTVVRGLRSPDGLAMHPDTGVLYVSQEDNAVVSAIVNGKPVTVIDARTPIYTSAGPVQMGTDPLRMPEGIAFSRGGELYVVEDRPGGRLIRFTLDSDGRGVAGEDIWVPGDWSHVAWEGVAVGPHGELLLSGSSAEDAVTGDAPSVFEGVLLYRDRTRNWWLLDRRPLRSFSQAAFSRDGSKIVYACEVTGEISWMDVSGKRPRWGASVNYAAKAPEGICILSDGRVIVAEEQGNLFLVDPETDHVRLLASAAGTLESLIWDERSHELLATEDRTGTILKWKVALRKSQGRYAIDRARFEPAHTPRHIPERCPDFLAKVLAFGGVDFNKGEAPLPFKVFAGRAPLVAVDAVTMPIGPADSAATDPIVRLQAVVFRPDSMTMPGIAQSGPLAVVIVTTRSGKVIKTSSKDVSAAVASLAAPCVQAAGKMRVTVPLPGPVGVSENGVCNLHLMGMGEIPDFHIVLNPVEPEASYVVVDDGLKGTRQYQLAGPHGEDLSRHMVISFSKELATPMRWLGRDEKFAANDHGVKVVARADTRLKTKTTATMGLRKFAGALYSMVSAK